MEYLCDYCGAAGSSLEQKRHGGVNPEFFLTERERYRLVNIDLLPPPVLPACCSLEGDKGGGVHPPALTQTNETTSLRFFFIMVFPGDSKFHCCLTPHVHCLQ